MAEESSFGDVLSAFERDHQHGETSHGEALEGFVIQVTPNAILVDIGMKREGLLPLDEFVDEKGEPTLKSGDAVNVSVTGRSPEGYYKLSTVKVVVPKDWSMLEQAYADGDPVSATVTGVIKGGLSVDVGARAFMPASRSGARDAAEMAALVGQEIRCKIIQLDTAKEDVVVDRRAVLEQEAAAARAAKLAEIKEGAVLSGVVRSLTGFGAFVDIGGIDGLLHVTDMAWHRVQKPADLLKEGETIEVKVLKVNAGSGRVSLGRKQLIPDPWSVVDEKYKQGDRVTGTVVRLTDFGAFVQLEPGVDGMIHVSELSWTKKIRKPSDVLTKGEAVEAVVLNVDGGKRRIALGLKQALGDPWADVETKYPAGLQLEVKISNMAKFGAFAEIEEGIEGMIHIADITNEKRLEHPSEVLSSGQMVKVKVLEIDKSRKRIRLGMKQLEPTNADEYIADHKVGDEVTGRVVDVKRKGAKIDLGEGVFAMCRLTEKKDSAGQKSEVKADLSSLTAMLAAKWKEGNVGSPAQGGGLKAGQIHTFRISSIDPEHKKIELELPG